MHKKLNTILLLDDNIATNFLNKKFINEAGCAEHVVDFQSGVDALDYLNIAEQMPELIFIDINMPVMNAWEFLGEFSKMQKSFENLKVILLSTSLSPKDAERAKDISLITDIKLKPLSIESVNEVISQHFSNN